MEKTYAPIYRSLQDCCLEWRVIEENREALELVGVFVFSEDFAGFAGHFPGQAILPAIVQLASVRFLAEQGLGQSVLPTEYSRTKFRAIIQPGDRVEVQLKLTSFEENWTGSFTLHKRGEEMVASGMCEFYPNKKAGS